MQLPAGGTYHGQVACNKALTTYGQNDYQLTEYACNDDKPESGTGAMHTTDKMGSPNPTDVKGCGLAIAYESDVSKLKPEDFTVISVRRIGLPDMVKADQCRSRTSARGRGRSTFISRPTSRHAPRADVTAAGAGSTRRMAAVRKCTTSATSVMSPELPPGDHYLVVSRLVLVSCECAG